MVVMKFGGSSLRDVESVKRTADIIKRNRFSRRIVVLSAFYGVTDMLVGSINKALEDEKLVKLNIEEIESFHTDIIKGIITDREIYKDCCDSLNRLTSRIEKLLRGVSYTGEATPRTVDQVLSTGERISVHIMANYLKQIGVNAIPVETDRIGLVAEGEWGNGTVERKSTRRSLCRYFNSIIKENALPVVTGFFGRTPEGDTITFGRGGSDYTAAVIADAVKVERLEIWKDVDGFLSGSPEVVENSRLLNNLSYEEAAELAYFGAKILHPRTIEPLLVQKIPIVIRNTFNPNGIGTWIGEERYIRDGVVKSVTYNRSIALLRIHGADVGYTVGLLHLLVSDLSRIGVNIRSVMTSQTCINILLDKDVLRRSVEHLRSIKLEGVDSLEPIEDVGLIAIVGEGLSNAEEPLAKAVHCLTKAGLKIEIIVSGASRVASYFVVRENNLEKGIREVHRIFFE